MARLMVPVSSRTMYGTVAPVTVLVKARSAGKLEYGCGSELNALPVVR